MSILAILAGCISLGVLGVNMALRGEQLYARGKYVRGFAALVAAAVLMVSAIALLFLVPE